MLKLLWNYGTWPHFRLVRGRTKQFAWLWYCTDQKPTDSDQQMMLEEHGVSNRECFSSKCKVHLSVYNHQVSKSVHFAHLDFARVSFQYTKYLFSLYYFALIAICVWKPKKVTIWGKYFRTVQSINILNFWEKQ